MLDIHAIANDDQKKDEQRKGSIPLGDNNLAPLIYLYSKHLL